MIRPWAVAAVAAALALASELHAPPTSTGRVPAHRSYVRGVALGLFASDPEWDYGPMVEEIRRRGATDVLVVVNGFQSSRFASDVRLSPGRSPSLHNVERTLRAVRGAGMRAALMPVVRLDRRGPGDWRGVITPADGAEAWFSAYRRFVLPLAEIAGATGARRLVVGSELNALEDRGDLWRALIADVRARFDGTVSYSANWDRAHAVPFWNALDEVGLTAYFPLQLQSQSAPSPEQLARAWRAPRAQIDALSRRTGKPVVVTEIGYPSQRGVAAHPWDDTTGAPVDLALQRRLYEGFCDALADAPAVRGFYVWNWFGYGGPRDPGFSPRGKPAASALAECFARELGPTSGARKGDRS